MEKSESASYQLRDVAQSWYNVWKDSKAFDGGPITLDLFKMDFLERFFLRWMKEAKVEELTTLKQGSMSVGDYFLIFIKL